MTHREQHARAALERRGCLHWAERFCTRRGVDLVDVLSVSRIRELVRVRDELISTLRDTLDLELSETGRIFGMNHASVWAIVKKRGARLKKERGESRNGPPAKVQVTRHADGSLEMVRR